MATILVAARLLPRVGLAAPVSFGEVVASTRFGVQTYLHTMAGQVHERVDVFLVAMLDGDPVHVATYAVAVGVAGRLRMLPLALSAALFPKVAQMAPADGARLTAQVVRTCLALLTVGGVILACLAVWLVPLLFGPIYAASVWPLWVLLPATQAMSVYLLVGRYFQGVDRQGINVVAQVLGVACNLGFNLWWIPVHGPLGAAMASLVSYGIQAMVVVAALSHRGEVGVAQLLVVQHRDLEMAWEWIQRWRR